MFTFLDAKQLTEWEKSCNILFGMKPTSSEMNLSYMPNYKGSVDFMFEKQKPTQFFLPTVKFNHVHGFYYVSLMKCRF